MGKQEHTPGPWRVEIESGMYCGSVRGAKGACLTTKDGFCLQILPDDGAPQEEFAANARLIAAAPTLKESAEEALYHLEKCERGEAMTVLREAIECAEDGRGGRR